MGMVHTKKNSKWNTTVQSFVDKKRKYQLDGWAVYPSEEVKELFRPICEWVERVSPTAGDTCKLPVEHVSGLDFDPLQIQDHGMSSAILRELYYRCS